MKKAASIHAFSMTVPTGDRPGRELLSAFAPGTSTIMACEYCGQEVSPLSRAELGILHGAEPEKAGRRAFECKTCMVVLFEDELIDRRFIPHFWLTAASKRKRKTTKKRISIFRHSPEY